MALFETKKVVDGNGRETVEKAGPFSKATITSQGNTTCISKGDIFGVTERETCVTTPSMTINNSNTNK